MIIKKFSGMAMGIIYFVLVFNLLKEVKIIIEEV